MRLRAYIIAGATVCSIIVAVLLIPREDPRADAELATRIITAVRRFSESRVSVGRVAPSAVSFRELIEGGFLSEVDARRFGAADVSVSLSVDEAYPDSVLMRARMPDGRAVCLMTDGSVQQARP